MNGKIWRQLTPFYFYTVVALTFVTAAAISETRSLTSIVGLCLIGVLTWGVIEYSLHRFAFHFEAQTEKGRKRVYAMHLSHHEDPRNMDDLFAGLRLSLPLAFVYCLLAWSITRSWQAVAYLFAGLTLGYFTYEFLHYQAHHLSLRLRLFRYLKKYHLLHHHQSSALRFGVTSPLFDYLFGTFKSTVQKRS
jgi:sterol desaturase/sphingolipid hydroxylase (fatty acid hydroxylase superfamily)